MRDIRAVFFLSSKPHPMLFFVLIEEMTIATFVEWVKTLELELKLGLILLVARLY